MKMELKNSLGSNGEFAGLYGEVVTSDSYRIRDVDDIVSVNDSKHVHVAGHKGIDFIPDVIFDLGANVGVFTRYCRSLFPNALIVAVEPDEKNCAVFREFTNDPNIILLQNAIGAGDIYRVGNAANGAMEVYLSEGLGYTTDFLSQTQMQTNVKGIMLTDLVKYIKGKVLLKLDIEGNETVIFNDKASMDLMKTFDYIVMELHYFASDGATLNAVKEKTFKILEELKETHITSFDTHVYFYATKK
jgi:FkbM family methyltransferase